MITTTKEVKSSLIVLDCVPIYFKVEYLVGDAEGINLQNLNYVDSDT